MPRQKKSSPASEKDIKHYQHNDKHRTNNPQVGLVDPTNDPERQERKTYTYDPHLDPELQWAGKAERTNFDIDSVSLHVHERIHAKRIVEQTHRKSRNAIGNYQFGLFEQPFDERPLREEMKFYEHENHWANRLIAGDSLLVMNSLLEKESMAGKVQMIYIDPPYGIKYGSNFQPFVGKRDVKDGKEADLTAEPEMIRAFRDTWELGIHSYLTYLRDRLLLARELLSETGSCFVQISDENVHLVRNLMDEVFGRENFMAQISFRKKMALGSKYLAATNDYIIWFAKNINSVKYNKLFQDKGLGEDTQFTWVETDDGVRRRMTKEEKAQPEKIPREWKIFRTLDLHSSGRTESCVFDFEFNGEICAPARGRSWKTNSSGMQNLIEADRIIKNGVSPEYILYHHDFPVSEITSVWSDTQGASDKKYVCQTSEKPVQRCMLMTTDPGDLVLDPTCGSGTTAAVAEQWGRRWITTDTSRVSLAIARQRLLTAAFPWYRLADEQAGVGGGFQYRTVPHITLGSIANGEPAKEETLYDQPLEDRKVVRVSGPFTVEAVPSLTPINAVPISEASQGVGEDEPDSSVGRSGESSRQSDWQDRLLASGIRGKSGEKISFTRVESLPGTRYLHAEAETEDGKRAFLSFGPEHAPLEQRQVGLALSEAEKMRPSPDLIVFAAFQFDPEAAKDIDETQWKGVQLLKAQMNTDLLTQDLRKPRKDEVDLFWLVGQPDVEVRSDQDGKFVCEVRGFDYYDPVSGRLISGGKGKIAMWMLDTDYDERSIMPDQVFFPMSGDKDGWSKLAKNLKAELDPELIDKFSGTTSIPFAPGENRKIAVKVVDDRGIESFVIKELSDD